MPKTRKRRRRTRGGQWWNPRSWFIKSKKTPISFNNAVMVKKPLKGVKKFDPEAYDKSKDVGMMMKSAMETNYETKHKSTQIDKRAHESPYDRERRRTAPARKARAARHRAEKSNTGGRRLRKRTKRRRRSRRKSRRSRKRRH